MSTNYSAGPGSQSPYGYGQQPGYAGPPSNASGSGGAVVMIIIALGVVILLALACGAAAVGFLFFARASQNMGQMETQAEAMRLDSMPHDSTAPPMIVAPLEEPTLTPFTPTEPARASWSYPTSPEGASGSITQQDASNWLEARTDNQTMRFTEVTRTDEYVELYDAERRLDVRLLGDHMEWRRDGQEWFRGQDGSWQAPVVTEPANTSQPGSSAPPQP